MSDPTLKDQLQIASDTLTPIVNGLEVGTLATYITLISLAFAIGKAWLEETEEEEQRKVLAQKLAFNLFTTADILLKVGEGQPLPYDDAE